MALGLASVERKQGKKLLLLERFGLCNVIAQGLNLVYIGGSHHNVMRLDPLKKAGARKLAFGQAGLLTGQLRRRSLTANI
jgi:hypothetical protein